MLVHEFLERSAQSRPEAIALVHGDDRVTYGEIESGANRIGRLLVQEGFRRGERLGLLAENSRFYVEAFFGVLKAGCVVVPLNTFADAASLRATLADCGARGLLVSSRLTSIGAGIADDPGRFAVVVVPEPSDAQVFPAHQRVACVEADTTQGEAGAAPRVPVIDLDRAVIVYTSGSTGRPKGATLRHLNVVSNTRSIVSYLRLVDGDRMLVVLPFFYVYGQSLLTTHVAVGGRLVIENRFLFPTTVLDTLEREAATGLAGVPSTFAILLHKTNFAQRPMPSLRYVTQAGGAMAPALTRQLMEALPGRKIYVMYGATEASARLAYLPPEELPHHVGSIGRAIPNVELRVLRDDGSDAAVDEVGEIVARGSNIMEAYWGDAEETARVLDADGYHTGDLARRDAAGFLWIVGRKRDMIKSGAHRVSPKEIEDALVEFPAIHEVAVIGVPDELLGEAIEAHVVLRPGATVDSAEVQQFARQHLPAYKVPRTVRIWKELPKSAAGKIQKDRLRTAASTGGGPSE